MDQKHPSHYIHPDENSKELGVVSGTSALKRKGSPAKTHKKWLNNVKQINATLWLFNIAIENGHL